MSIPDESARVLSSGLTMEQEIKLYDAIGRFAEASRLSSKRQLAVVEIGRIIKTALAGAERAALERAAQACVSGCPTSRVTGSPCAGCLHAAERIRALMPPPPNKEDDRG